MSYIIVYHLPDGKALYCGRGWMPIATKRSAVRFQSYESALDRFKEIKKVKDIDPKLLDRVHVESVKS